MSFQYPDTSYNQELAERVVGLIESKSDAAALSALASAPSSLRAEAAREFLWRGDDQGYQEARKLVLEGVLSTTERASIFLAAAECGETRMLKLIAKTSSQELPADTIRAALLGALYGSQADAIRWIADTDLLSTEAKYQAITPSIFKSPEIARGKGRARNELGTAEIVITKQYRDAQYELRQQKREERLAERAPSREETQHLRIERTFSKILTTATNHIRAQRQRYTSELQGAELHEHREITSLLIEQVAREVSRQREIALAKQTSDRRVADKKSDRTLEVANWRSTNPAGHEDSPSFAEMLETFFHERHGIKNQSGVTISDFIESVLATWGTDSRPMSRESLSKLIEEKHPQNATLSNSVMYHWRNCPDQTPNTESITTIVEAFRLHKSHGLLLFRIAKGIPCSNLEMLVADAEEALKTPNEADARGELFTALTDAAGIPLVDLSTTLSIHQIHMWKRGQRIDSPAIADRLLDLLNPIDIYPKEDREEARALNVRIKAILGGRSASIFGAVFLAQRSDVTSRGGLLFSQLIGRRGIAPLSEKEAATILGVTEGKVRRMGRPSRCRGGDITESIASSILDYVQGVTPSTRHHLSPIQKTERALAIDILTGIPSPIQLLMKVERGELPHVGELYRLVRHRRGIQQPAKLSDFELGKANITHVRASAMADWLGFKGLEHRESRRLFITRATGYYTTQSPSEILNDIVSGKLERHMGIQKLFDWTGLTRGDLARKIGIPEASVRSYSTAQSGGRILNHRRLSALAEELGLRHRLDDLVSVFTPKTYTPPLPPT